MFVVCSKCDKAIHVPDKSADSPPFVYRDCDVCKIEHEKYRNNFINTWDKKCECGCGKITLVGNKRILGHGPTGVKRTEKQLRNLELTEDDWEY